jgi:serine/threonine protein kinase
MTEMVNGVELVKGDVLQDRYVVREALGSGGMATAFLVHDSLWGVDVTLKLISSTSPELLEALQFEFATLRIVHHRHLARVFDFSLAHAGQPGGRCFYTAEYVAGRDLEERARGASWRDVLPPLRDAAEALRLLHTLGILHGDVKPANMLVEDVRQGAPDGSTGRGVLIDLGCARPLLRDLREHEPVDTVSGTPGFLAPELLTGVPVDQRADLFAFGATLARLAELVDDEPPVVVLNLAKRLLRPDPSDRPASVDEVLQVLGVEPAAIHPVAAELGHMVGRAEELTAARRLMGAFSAHEESSDEDEPRALHIFGPEGVGRTRFLAEVKWIAQQRCRVLEANSSAADAVTSLLAATLGREMSASSLEGVLRGLDEI